MVAEKKATRAQQHKQPMNRECASCGGTFATHNVLRRSCAGDCGAELRRLKMLARSRDCQQCGVRHVSRRKGVLSQFCSHPCYSESMRGCIYGRLLRDRQCEQCDSTFSPPVATSRFCTRDCANEYKRQHPHLHVCPQCAESYKRKRKTEIFCSNKCRDDSRRLAERQCLECGSTFKPKNAKQCLCSSTCRHEAKRTLNDRLCEATGCGKVFIPFNSTQRCCSYKCSGEARRTLVEKQCANCGEMFMPHKNCDKYCSKLCGFSSMHVSEEAKRATRHACHARRRARKHGVAYEYIRRDAILKRDNWRCQQCNRKVRLDVAVTDGRYANLDHIIPLSKGGSHTRDNVQILCLRCNMHKGARVNGDQLLLAGVA